MLFLAGRPSMHPNVCVRRNAAESHEQKTCEGASVARHEQIGQNQALNPSAALGISPAGSRYAHACNPAQIKKNCLLLLLS
jgi:hypothetical protein